LVDLVGTQARRCTCVAKVTNVMGSVQGEQDSNELGFTEDQCRIAIDTDLHFPSGALQHGNLGSKLGVAEFGGCRKLQGHRISVQPPRTAPGVIHRQVVLSVQQKCCRLRSQ
jgi:hypothetical protein